MLVPQPYGEVADRLVILDLKLARVGDPAKRAATQRLRDAIAAAWTANGLPALDALPEYGALCEVNAALWDVEDALRAHEARADFGDAFVALARAVYAANDRRAALKAAIDRRLGSPLSEPKSHLHG